jgi:hypothetical protein
LVDLLAGLEPEERTALLPFLNEAGCESIYTCVHNALHNKDISKAKRSEIRRHLKKDEGCYRSLLKTDLHAKVKQKKLCQVGGKSLGILLNAVLPLMIKSLVQNGQLGGEEEPVTEDDTHSV